MIRPQFAKFVKVSVHQNFPLYVHAVTLMYMDGKAFKCRYFDISGHFDASMQAVVFA